jgi:hypothetical protein
MSEEFDAGNTFPCPCCGDTCVPTGRTVEFEDVGMDLAVMGGGEAVAEVVRKDDGRGELRVLPSESFVDAATGNRVHVVDVQGEREAFLMVVAISQQDGIGTIASLHKIC